MLYLLVFCGNINVNVAISLYKKQILPILTYGSIFGGLSDCYNKLYINDIPEDVKLVKSLNTKLRTGKIIRFKRVGIISNRPRKIIASMSSYQAKINLSNSKVDNFVFDDFNKSNFDSTFEQVQTNFFKFILDINKFASNHAIRAELGKFPVQIYTDLKLVNY